MSRLSTIFLTILTAVALTACLVPRAPVQAQDGAGPVYFGIKGGIAQSTVRGGDLQNADSQQGSAGGLFFTFQVNEFFSVQPEVLYQRQGATSIDVTGGPNVSDALDLSGDDIKVDYVEVPLLFKLTAPIEGVNLRGYVGPSVSAVTNAKINDRDRIRDVQSDEPFSDRLTPVDFSAVFGGEIAVPLPVGADEIALNGRYNYGFLSVYNEQEFEFTNSSLTGSLSIRFTIQ